MSEAVPDDVEPTPVATAGVFGERREIAQGYVDLLAREGVIRGLIGPRELPQLWSRHVLNSAVLGEAIEPSSTVVDIGTGAGFPGLPLAIARPDLTITLVEPLLRRTTFLDQAVSELGLSNVIVMRGRAEDASVLHAVTPADVVTSRAVAPLDRLARWSAPLVRIGGRMIALKGRSAAEEIAAHRSAVEKLGLKNLRVELCGELRLATPTTLLIGDRVHTKHDRKG